MGKPKTSKRAMLGFIVMAHVGIILVCAATVLPQHVPVSLAWQQGLFLAMAMGGAALAFFGLDRCVKMR
jgi:hypothetical protein